MNFDLQIICWFHAHQTPFLNKLMTDVSLISSGHACCICAGFIALVMMSRHRFTRGAMLFMGTLLATILVEFLKLMFARQRPPFSIIYDSYSFPSGHSTVSTVFIGLWVWFMGHLMPRLRIPFYIAAFAWVALVDMSRLYLGVHYPTDVIGGNLIGILFIAFWIQLVRMILHQTAIPKDDMF